MVVDNVSECRSYIFLILLQDIAPDSFITKPILFGDFIKMGQERADRLYEEFSDHKKLGNVLQDVSH